MAWIGLKKLALIPVYRPNALPPDQIPIDWNEQILRRVLFDPDPNNGPDRSLRAYIHMVSSGRADLDAVVMQRQDIDSQDVKPDALEGLLGIQLRAAEFDAAAIVMLGGPGAGSNAGFWSRFVMLEGVGVWAMEFMHSLTRFADLYPFNGNMGAFDEMACACGTHPSAYTKAAIGWLDASAIAQHSGTMATYDLHSVGLIQPPPSGRSTAIRVGSFAPYLMIEARQRVDQFDLDIPGEGVIVYRVQTSHPLGHQQNNKAPIKLLTPNALQPGMTFTSDTNVEVHVINTLPGGFTVRVFDPNQSGVYTIQQKSSKRFMDAHELEEKDFALVTRSAQNNDTQRWVLTLLGNHIYTIRQLSNGRFVDAYETEEKDFALVSRTAEMNDSQAWIIKRIDTNTYTIQQKSNGRYVDAHEVNEKDFAVVTRNTQNNDSQKWIIKSLNPAVDNFNTENEGNEQ